MLICQTALEVSGAAVQAEFEHWISAHVTQDDCAVDVDVRSIIRKLCHAFRDEKKYCGETLRPGKKYWIPLVPGLKRNPLKRIENGYLEINW